MSSKPVAAIDLGGTIEDSWNCKRTWFLQHLNIDIGEARRSRDELISFAKVDREIYDQMRRWVYSENRILDHGLIAGATEAIRFLSAHFEIALLSSREKDFERVTREWLASNHLVNFVGRIELVGERADKFAWACKNNIDLLIDDDRRHLGSGTPGGPRVRIHLDFNDRHQEKCISVQRAKTWDEVVAIVVSENLFE